MITDPKLFAAIKNDTFAGGPEAFQILRVDYQAGIAAALVAYNGQCFRRHFFEFDAGDWHLYDCVQASDARPELSDLNFATVGYAEERRGVAFDAWLAALDRALGFSHRKTPYSTERFERAFVSGDYAADVAAGMLDALRRHHA